MSSMKISVLMSVYKEKEDWLRQSVESILGQTYSDFEFIIVIDSPSDVMPRKLIYSYAKSDSRIKVIENNINIGLAKSLNKAFSVASGEYIARMDAGDISAPDRFERQLKYIKNNDLDFIGTPVIIMDAEGKHIGVSRCPTSNLIIKRFICHYTCLPHISWFVKKSVYDSLNGYADIGAAQDYDFLLRAKASGVRFGALSTPLVQVRTGDGGISDSRRLEQLINLYLLKKGKECAYSSIHRNLLADFTRYVNLERKMQENMLGRDGKKTKFIIYYFLRTTTTRFGLNRFFLRIYTEMLYALDIFIC